MYTLLLYNERDTSPIQYTENINERASLVNAIRQIQEKCSTPEGITEYSLLHVHVK